MTVAVDEFAFLIVTNHLSTTISYFVDGPPALTSTHPPTFRVTTPLTETTRAPAPARSGLFIVLLTRTMKFPAGENHPAAGMGVTLQKG